MNIKPHIKYYIKDDKWRCYSKNIISSGKTIDESYIIWQGFLGMIKISKGEKNVY